MSETARRRVSSETYMAAPPADAPGAQYAYRHLPRSGGFVKHTRTATARGVAAMTAVDESKQMDFIGQVIGDWEAMASVPVGELLGLSRAMAGSQPVAAGQLASRSEERRVGKECRS